MDDETMMLQVRVPRALVRKVDIIALEMGKARAVAIEHLLTLGLEAVGYRSPMGER